MLQGAWRTKPSRINQKILEETKKTQNNQIGKPKKPRENQKNQKNQIFGATRGDVCDLGGVVAQKIWFFWFFWFS